MSSSKIKDFKIDISQEDVDRLKRKLQDHRLPPKPIVPDAGKSYGPTYEWGEHLVNTWRNDFDWYEHQKRINTAPHYIYSHPADEQLAGGPSDGSINIHFLHARSKREDAIPLIMVHGWPGSFYEFNQVWGPLSNPEDDSQPAFHVVVPSLPGYGWSDWPPRSKWTLQDTTKVYDSLMKELGYSKLVY